MSLSSCGKQRFPDYRAPGPDLQHDEGVGLYRAEFFPINELKNTKIRAHSIFWTKEKQFYAKIVMERGPANIRYQQYIHKGPFCPGPEHDRNRDSIIDFHEVLFASGEMLVPLDGNLRSQAHGGERFPVSDEEGKYYYSQSTSVLNMMKDLRLEDPFPDDGLGKLNQSENLDISRRTVILYGSPSDPLLPVACGRIKEDLTYRE